MTGKNSHQREYLTGATRILIERVLPAEFAYSVGCRGRSRVLLAEIVAWVVAAM